MNRGKPQTTPEDFKDFLAAPDKDGKPTVVIGGHAVNLWADFYSEAEPEIRQFEPFVSKDLDLLGGHDAVAWIARKLKQEPMSPPKGDPNPVLGRFIFTTSRSQTTSIEVLFTVYGVLPDEIRQAAIIVHSPNLRTTVRLPHPVTCLKAKTHNAAQLNQQHRQDVKHVRILLLVNRAFLRDAIHQAEQGRISERAAVRSLEVLFKFTLSKIAQEAAAKHSFNWLQAFPVPELQHTPLPRLQRFYQHRLAKTFLCPPLKS